MTDENGKPIIGTFTPETYALASFSLIERLMVLLEAKGVLTASEHTAIYAEAAQDFRAPENLGTKPQINLAVADLMAIMVGRTS